MKDRVKSLSVSLILLALIALTVWIGYVGFIGGPARAYEREDQVHVEAMMTLKGYTQGKLINRFAFDQVYYITEITEDETSKIVWFNKDLDVFGEHEMTSFDPVLTLAENYGITENQMSYGVYKERLVYVFKKRNFEKFIDVDTLEVVFDRGSGF